MSGRDLLATARGQIVRGTGETHRWQVEAVLAGQDVRCLAVDPLDRRVVYAGAGAAGVWRSGDGGRSWAPAGLGGQAIRSLAASPTRPGVVYAGTRPPALYLSEDGGQSWRELPALRAARRFWWFSPAEPPGLTPYVQAIALSPTDSDVLLAGIEVGGVLRSADGGRHWSRHRRGAVLDCHSLIFHHSQGQWAYEGGGSGGGAAVSRDGGERWQQPRDGLDRAYGWAVAADPARPEVWYHSASPAPSLLRGELSPPAHVDGRSNAAIYRSAGNGPWERLAGGLPEPLHHFPYALVTDPSAPGHLYTGLANGDVWHSTDHGDTWNHLPVNLGAGLRDLVLV